MKQLFNLHGRISRSTFWCNQLIAFIAFVILFVAIDDLAGRAATWILYPPYLWMMLSQAIKRLHDRNRTAAWLLAALIPVLGPLWLLFDLGLRRGTPGENSDGPDPLDNPSGYLTVDIHHP